MRWLREVHHTRRDSGDSYYEQDYRQDTSHRLTLPDLGSKNPRRVDGYRRDSEGFDASRRAQGRISPRLPSWASRGIGLVTEALQERRRALEVGEEKER